MKEMKRKQKLRGDPRVTVRFSGNEWDHLQKKSAQTGRSIAHLCRRAIIDGVHLLTPKFSADDTQRVIATLNRIGNNVNQIARELNSGIRKGWNLEFSRFANELTELRASLTPKYGNHKA